MIFSGSPGLSGSLYPDRTKIKQKEEELKIRSREDHKVALINTLATNDEYREAVLNRRTDEK